MKKILIAVISTAALSGTVSAKGFTGFYLGADAAANLYQTEHTLKNNAAAPGTLFMKVNGHSSSFNMGLFAGYSRQVMSCFILGLEAFGMGDFSDARTLESSDRSLVTMRNKGISVGFLVRSGIRFTEKTAVMVGLGGKTADYQYAYVDVLTPAAANNFNARSQKFLFTVQAGFEGVFGSNDSFAWRATYGFTPGNDVNVAPLPVGSVYGNGTLGTGRFETNEHTMRFGLSYRI